MFRASKTDPVVKLYSAQADRNAPTESQIQQTKRDYQQSLLEELFSMKHIQQSFSRLHHTYQEHQTSLSREAFEQVKTLQTRANAELFEIAERFRPHLAAYLADDGMPDSNAVLQVRVRKAATYFTEKIGGLLKESASISTVTDNQALGKDAVSQLEGLQLALFAKNSTFAACSEGFSPRAYQRAKANAELDFVAKFAASQRVQSSVPNGICHPDLYRLLLQFRDQKAEESGRMPNEILPGISLRQLVMNLPTTNSNLREIPGIGKSRLKKYGADIIGSITKYCEAQSIPTAQMSASSSPRPQASATKLISFELFRSGKTIEQIAAECRLVPGTIEGHLVHFVALGQLDVFSILSRDKLADIQQYFEAHPTLAAAEAKAHFGDKYSYGEINVALGHIRKDSRVYTS